MLGRIKESLHCLDTVEIHASNFDNDIHGTDGPAITDQEMPTGHATSLSLPPLLHDRLATAGHMLSIPFQLSLTHPNSRTKRLSKIFDTTEHTGLGWQIKED